MTRAILWIGCVFVCFGQSQTPAPFEVASIKLNTNMTQQQAGVRADHGGGVSIMNFPLRSIIAFAYDVREYQVSGGAKWIDGDRWDIIAKLSAEAAAVEPEKPNKDSMARMKLRMRALLADRFQLVVRPETREMPIYGLKVGKDGPKMEVWKEGSETHIYGNGQGIEAGKVTMKLFAENVLSRSLGRPVVDQTGLTGEYNFTLKFEPEPPKAPGDADAPTDLASTSLIDAVREQLGLKLEAQKGPVEVLTIERAERAAN